MKTPSSARGETNSPVTSPKHFYFINLTAANEKTLYDRVTAIFLNDLLVISRKSDFENPIK